jgi:tetratricopeptide (TPR) repeat protein
MFRFASCAVLAVAAFAADPQYELSGRFTPEGPAYVSLYGTTRPFTTSTESFGNRFTFKKLRPDAYTLAVYMPGRGEARQTIEVGPSTADARGRVQLDLNFKDSDFVVRDALRQRHTVSASQLTVPDKAMREYEDAQKDLSKDDVEAAIKHLERAVDLAPQFASAWNNLGTIAYQTQKYARAEECFREALEADPTMYEPLVNLGGVLVNLHKLDEAWELNVAAVLARPNDPLAHSQLGMTYFGIGEMNLAEKHFREASRLDPAHFSHPQLFLAEIHLRRGDRRAAAADMEQFLKYHPDWPQAEKMRQAIAELKRQ